MTHAVHLVEAVLGQAGFKPGRHARHGLKYSYEEPTVPGYLVEMPGTEHWENRMNDRATGTRWTRLGPGHYQADIARPDAPRVFGWRITIDHAGPGQKAALVRYAAALRAAGLRVTLGPKRAFGCKWKRREGKPTKRVLYLNGIYGRDGELLAGRQPVLDGG